MEGKTMLKKMMNINPQEVKILGSAVLPFAQMAVSRVFSPLFGAVSKGGPGSHAPLAVPTSAQGTGYYVRHSDPYRR